MANQTVARYETRWSHIERRSRVSMNDYICARMERAGAFAIDIEAARLLYSPVSMPRRDSRKQCRLSNKTLNLRAAKF